MFHGNRSWVEAFLGEEFPCVSDGILETMLPWPVCCVCFQPGCPTWICKLKEVIGVEPLQSWFYFIFSPFRFSR